MPRLTTQLKFNYAIIGADLAGKNFGNNIFNSDNTAYYGVNSTENKMGQGVKTILTYKEFHIGYLVNPVTNLNVVLGVSLRNRKTDFSENKIDFIYFGIRTSLDNFYYDF